MLIKKIFFILVLFLLSCALPAFAAEKLDPFSAELTVIPGKTSARADIRAVLDIYIHNGDEGSLIGSKFVCMQDIESLTVTDGEGRRLPFTLKSYPRKRIMWEYGPSKKGVRRAVISFLIRNAVKREGEACTMDVDWVSGWNREVFNASYSIVLPETVAENDLISVSPPKYKFAKAGKGSRITYTFPVLDIKTVRVVYKSKPGAAAPKDQEKKDEAEIKAQVTNEEAPAKVQNEKEPPAVAEEKKAASEQPKVTKAAIPVKEKEKEKAKEQAKTKEKEKGADQEKDKSPGKEAAPEKYSISNIRSAPNGTKDRLVFDVNKKIPYEISYPPEADELEILWQAPVDVSGKALDKKKISSGLIKGVRWKKSADKKLSTIVQLQKKDLKIKYGSLESPPRFYIDIFNDSDEKTDGYKQQPKASVEAKPEPIPAAKSTDNKTKNESLIQQLQKEIKSDNVTTPAPAAPLPASKTELVPPPVSPGAASKIASIEEKLAYTKVRKLFELKEYENAISAFEGFLTKYPGTIMMEEILFDMADAYCSLAEKRDPKNYNDAITTYKKAVANFPESARAPYASFQIAECHRKGGFYIEASSQYSLILERYPNTTYSFETRFWMAECFFQMGKFEDALKEFEKFVNEYPTGPHARDASFRIADCYSEIKDFDRAEFYYEKALKRWPELMDLQVKTLNNIAMTNYYKGKFEKSRELLFLSFNLYSTQENREQLLRFIGDSYQWEGDMQKALNIYGLLMDIFPEAEECAIAVMRMADLGVNIAGLQAEHFKFKDFSPYKDPEKAYRWITENAKTREILTEALFKLGFTLAKQGNYGDAVELFKKSMTQKNEGQYYTKSVENIQKILTRMIHMAAAKEDYFSVVELYKKNEAAFISNPNDCAFFYEIGRGYLEVGLLADAEKILAGIVKTTDNPECRQKSIICLSRIDLDRGNAEKAQERLNILLYGSKVLASVTDEANQVLGDACFQDKKYKEAIDAYSAALKDKDAVSLRQARSLLRLGESFGRTGYDYNGIQALKKLTAIADRVQPQGREILAFKDEAQLLIGDFQFRKGNYNAAISAYRELTQTAAGDEKKGWAFLKWGEALMQKGDYDNATKMFTHVAEKIPYTVLKDFAQSQINGMKWQKNLQTDLKEFM